MLVMGERDVEIFQLDPTQQDIHNDPMNSQLTLKFVRPLSLSIYLLYFDSCRGLYSLVFKSESSLKVVSSRAKRTKGEVVSCKFHLFK